MAMQVNCAFAHTVPGPEGIVTEHKGNVVDRYLRVRLYAVHLRSALLAGRYFQQ
jgi:hypothetical protein